jgi:ABC-type iron transport system FetAB permease component
MTLKGFLKGIVYASFAIIPMLAWYISESTFFPYITGKNFAFRFLIEIAFAAFAYLAVVDRAYRPKSSLVFYSYGAFLSILFLANVFGSNVYLSFFSNFERMEGWFTHLHLFLYFLMLYSLYKTDKDWMRVFGWFSVGAIGVSLQALLQLFGQKDFFLTSKIFATSTVQFINNAYPVSMGNGLRLDSSLGNADYYGIYALFFICISALLALKLNTWKIKNSMMGWKSFAIVSVGALLISLQSFISQKAMALSSQNLFVFGSFIWFVGSVIFLWGGYYFAKNLSEGHVSSWVFVLIGFVNFVGLIYTQTRGSWVGFAAAIGAASLSIVIGGWKRYPKLAHSAAAVILAIATFFVLVFSFSDSKLVQNSIVLKRISTIKVANMLFHPVESINLIKDESNNYESLKAHFGEATIVSRFLNMKMSIVGVTQSAKTMILGYGQENYPVVFAQNFDPRMYEQESWFDRAHDVFMDWLVAAGALGLIAYLSLYLTPFYMMWFGKNKGNINLFEKAILTGTLAGYFVHNIFVFDNLISYIIFVTLIAYVAARTRATDAEIRKEEAAKDPKMTAVSYVLITAGALFSLGLFIFTVVKPLNQNLTIISALRSSPTKIEDLVEKTASSSNYFSGATRINSFGRTEAREQMLQTAMRYSQLDPSSFPVDVKNNFISIFNDFKINSYNEFRDEVMSKPSARNASIFGSFLRQLGDSAGALEAFEKAHALAPKKQMITFEYINTLISTGAAENMQKAYELAKDAYLSDTGFAMARDVYITTAAMVGQGVESQAMINEIKLTDPAKAKDLQDKVDQIKAELKKMQAKK